jgi:hypothetical protein
LPLDQESNALHLSEPNYEAATHENKLKAFLEASKSCEADDIQKIFFGAENISNWIE